VSLARVVSPNGGEQVALGKNQNITIAQSGVNSLSVALYKNDQWKKWIVKDFIEFAHDKSEVIIPWLPGVMEAKEAASGTVFKIYVTAKKASGVGYVDDKSDAVFGFTSPTDTAAPSIQGLVAPSQLEINQKGTWTVKITDATDKLVYSVVWGDEATTTSTAGAVSQTQSSATFTHTYTKAGTYKPRFIVRNAIGKAAVTSASVTVAPPAPRPYCNIAPSSLALKFGQPVTINWLSQNATAATLQPNEGSVALKGSIQRTIVYAGQKLPFSKKWTLTATGPGGSIDCSVSVTYTLASASSTNTTNTKPSSYTIPTARTLAATAVMGITLPFTVVTDRLSDALVSLGLY
jgi:hypothetical protein